MRGAVSIVALVAGCAQILDIHDRGGGGGGDDDDAGPVLPAFPVGSPAVAIAATDFNGDTVPDLAIGADSAFVAINRGDGTFETPLPYELGVAVSAIATAFVNADTIPDLLVGDTDAKLTVLFGTASGLFAQAATYSLSAEPRDITTGYYAGSASYLGVNVADSMGQVDYLPGLGSGVLEQYPAIGANSIRPTLASTDFDGDGHTDMIIGDSLTNNVITWLGKDNMTFEIGPPFTMPAPTSSLALGDVDGDGRLDVVVAATTNEVTLMIGQVASPYYVVGESFTLPSTPVAVATGDVNHDGFADIVTADGSANTITVLLGDGTGHFATPKTISVAANPVALVVGDFNGDHIDDVAVACAGANGVSLVFGPL